MESVNAVCLETGVVVVNTNLEGDVIRINAK